MSRMFKNSEIPKPSERVIMQRLLLCGRGQGKSAVKAMIEALTYEQRERLKDVMIIMDPRPTFTQAAEMMDKIIADESLYLSKHRPSSWRKPVPNAHPFAKFIPKRPRG